MRLLCLALALLVASALSQEPKSEDGGPPPPDESVVIRVYDGDTVTIASGDPVRLRWVNTPELRPMEAFAEEARDLAASFVAGKLVQLNYGDPVRDGYGRLIADVIINGVSLEEKLLEAGFAHIMLIPPVEDGLEVLFEAQARAREARLGIWGHERYQGTLHITSFHANGRGNDRADPNSEYLRVCNITDEPVTELQLARPGDTRWPHGPGALGHGRPPDRPRPATGHLPGQRRPPVEQQPGSGHHLRRHGHAGGPPLARGEESLTWTHRCYAS